MNPTAIETLESRRLLAADLSAAITSTTLPDSLATGGKTIPSYAATVTVSDVGDPIAKKTKGNITVSLVLHPATGADVALGTATIAASKLATGPAAATIKFKQPATLVAGAAYTLRATVAGGTVVPETVTTNNTATGKSVTTRAANTPTGVLVPIGLGSKITFKKTGGRTIAGGFGNESGTFTDDAGKTGTYNLILGTGGLLTLKDAAGTTIGYGAITIVANANNGTPKVGGKTLSFGVPQAGSTGYVQVGGINGNVYYK